MTPDRQAHFDLVYRTPQGRKLLKNKIKFGRSDLGTRACIPGLGNSALKAPETQCGHGNLFARGSIVLQEFLKWEAQRLRQLFHVAHFGKSDASFSW